MIRVFKTSSAADASSAAAGAGQPPLDLPESIQACCSACGARLRSGAHFCSDCGTAHAAPAEDEAAAINSQFGGSSADLAELLASRGDVVPCPRCDELNNASAAYCRHCGQLLPAAVASPPAPRRGTLPALRFYGPEIALMTLLVITAALWLGRALMAPPSEATQSAASLSVSAAQPAESVVSPAPVDPVAPPTVPGASAKEQAEASPSASPPGAAQNRAPVTEGARKKVAKPPVQRASALFAIDDIYRQRAAQRCAEGLSGLICRQKLRFELCNKKWTQDVQSGMEICRLSEAPRS